MKLFSALSAVAARGDSRRSSALVAGWTIALAIAVLWPARVLSPLDGAPLNGRAEAVLIGLVLPVLWWLDRGFLMRRPARGGDRGAAGGEALRPRRAAAARSVRAILDRGAADRHDQHDHHRRTGGDAAKLGRARRLAVVRAALLRRFSTRTVSIESRVPVMVRQPPQRALRPESSPGSPGNSVALDIDGYVSVADAGTLVVETGGMTVDGRVGTGRVTAGNIPLAAGTHSIRLHAMLTGEDWKLVPLWNGRDAWTAARLTVTAPGWIDRFTSRAIAIVTPAIVLLLLTAWLLSALARHAPGPALAWDDRVDGDLRDGRDRRTVRT